MEDFHSKRYILIDRLLFQKSEVLEYHADLLPDPRDLPPFDLCNVFSGKNDPSAVRIDLLKDQPDECCLSGARWPYEEDEVSALDVDRRVDKSNIVSVFLGYVVENNH